jgi:hypothetical protein
MAGAWLSGLLTTSAWAQGSASTPEAQQPNSQGTAEGTAESPTPNSLTSTADVKGKVQSIDSSKNAVTLTSGKKITLDPNAEVTKDGQSASLSDVKQGDDVRASYAPGSKKIATKLSVTSGK